MATTKKNFNFGTTFKSAVKRGTPATTVVWNIANKTGKTETFVWNFLYKNGYVNRKKINGSWIYWPNFEFGKKTSTRNFKNFSFQQFVNWAIAGGYCTADQINSLKSQKDFFNFFGPFVAKQFGWTVNSGWSMSKVQKWGKTSTTSKRSSGSKRRTGSTTKRRKTTSTSKKRTSVSKRRPSTKAHAKRKATGSKSIARKSSARKSTARKSSTRGRKTTTARSYKFPKSGRSYRKVA